MYSFDIHTGKSYFVLTRYTFLCLFKCIVIVSQEKENSFLSFQNADIRTPSSNSEIVDKFKIILEEWQLKEHMGLDAK